MLADVGLKMVVYAGAEGGMVPELCLPTSDYRTPGHTSGPGQYPGTQIIRGWSPSWGSHHYSHLRPCPEAGPCLVPVFWPL